jgi:hypothetical protein
MTTMADALEFLKISSAPEAVLAASAAVEPSLLPVSGLSSV